MVDPVADEDVWATIDDGCNSCCHGEVWRQNAETEMKVLGLHPIWMLRKATTFHDVGTSTTSGKLKILMAIRLQESDMVIPRLRAFARNPEKDTSLVSVSGMSSKVVNDEKCA